MKLPNLVALAACALASACSGKSADQLPPTGQIVLYVTTDAPLPPAPGEAEDPNAPPALFDRLRIDLFPPGAMEPCADCSRDFELDRVRVQDGQASIGVVPPPGVSGYVARARLFRFISLQAGEPPPLSTLDVYAALPAVESEGIVRATITLRVDDIGTTRGSASTPTAALLGAPDFSQIGTWPKAQRVACTSPARLGEVCIPGGAFWLGHPFAGLHSTGGDASVSRLVTLSPYFVDLHEVTVAEFRASGLARLEAGSSIDPLLGHAPTPASAAKLVTTDDQYFCTYSDAALPGEQSREDQPLNCISWDMASAFCARQGKRLPSEAEYEYMASGLRSDLFVWGADTAVCGDSVWGRGGFRLGELGTNSDCRAPDDLRGSLSAGNGRLDRLIVNGQQVVDLMGNVSEWTRDAWNRTSEPCWFGQAMLDNPSCATPSAIDTSETGALHTVKGQAWDGLVFPAARREGDDAATPSLGFRCVRPSP